MVHAALPRTDASHTAVTGQVLAVVLADHLAEVRAAWRWLLQGQAGLRVAAEAGGVTAALAAPGDVVVAGLVFADGTAADLCTGARPVVVITTLPADERRDIDLRPAAAVLRTGTLRRLLAPAIRAAGRAAGTAAGGRH